jgi:hypothetical protein
MKRAIEILLFVVLSGGGYIHGQTVTLSEIFFREYITFYVSSVDVSTGAMDFEWFEYELNSTSYPVWVQVEFGVLINSMALNITYDTPFLYIVTNPLRLLGPVRWRNTDLNINTDDLVYSAGEHAGEKVGFTVSELSHILEDPAYNIEEMQSLIMQTGRLPDGTYRFSHSINVWADDNGMPGASLPGTSLEKTIISAHPVALELISPGGALEDLTNTAIMTTYPFFQWESDPCPICTYQIRVAEFKPDEHSSMEDAIEDQTVLPLDQALGYHDVGQSTFFQYPQTEAVPLLPGHVYVWQVQKIIPTTEGDETVGSFIYAFKVAGRPQAFQLGDNCPNPFTPNPINPYTIIWFALARDTEVSLVLMDILGQQVAQLGSGHYEAGRHEVFWNGRNEAGEPAVSGVYFYRLVTPGSAQTKKMLLLK